MTSPRESGRFAIRGQYRLIQRNASIPEGVIQYVQSPVRQIGVSMTMAEVIVVASDAAFRHSLVFVLESGGFRVLPFDTLETALGPPHNPGARCAVVDEEAVADWEHARQLFRIFARPVILLVERSRRSPLGTVRYLTKPFLGEPLLRAVHDAIAGS